MARGFLEDARRAAVVIDGERLELLGDRRHREAASRGDVADHRIDLVALDEVAEFGDDLRRRAGLVDVFRLDLGAAEAHGVVGRRCGPGVEGLDQDFRAVAPGNAERRRRGTGQERHDAELHGGRRGLGGGAPARGNGKQQTGQRMRRRSADGSHWPVLPGARLDPLVFPEAYRGENADANGNIGIPLKSPLLPAIPRSLSW